MSTKTQTLIRYDILISATSELNDDLMFFMQKCIWARKRHEQKAFGMRQFGHFDEYVLYDCELTGEDLLCLKLKFTGIVHVVEHDPRRDDDATFKLATNVSYYNSTEARITRALAKFNLNIRP